MSECRKSPLFYDKYYITDNGKVFRSDCTITRKDGIKIRLPATEIKQFFDRDGYKTVTLSKDNKQRTFKVHYLVAKHFVSNPLSKPQINHIDKDKTNNTYTNLEWVTSKENVQHSLAEIINGNIGKSTKKRPIYSIKDNKIEHFESLQSAARKLGIVPSCILKALSKRLKTYKGREWFYE